MRKCSLLIIVLTAAFSAPLAQAQQRTTSTGGNTTGTQSLQAQGVEAQQTQGGTITGSERFLRENQELGRVIGATTEGVGFVRGTEDAAASQTGRGGTTQFGSSRGRLSSMFNQFNQFNRNTGRTTTRQLRRVPFELGFTPVAAASPADVSQRIQTRLERIPRIREFDQVSLDVEGRTAVLRGQVASANDRELLARMVSMEPGISDVRNELTLVEAAATPPVPPAPVP